MRNKECYVAIETGLESRVKICGSYKEARGVINSWIGEYLLSVIEDDDYESYKEFFDKITITDEDESKGSLSIIDNSIGEFYEIVKTEIDSSLLY